MRIILNRSGEWARALLDGLIVDGHVLRGMENSTATADSALMISGSADSFENDQIWDKISFDWSFAQNTSCRVSCYASNSKIVEPDGKPIDLDEWLKDENTPIDRRVELIENYFSPINAPGGDGLLNCRGRYLWLKLDIAAQDRGSFELRSIKLMQPGEKITDYLPDVYRKGLDENDFFPRFMSIFDSIFFDLEDDINRIGERLDYRITEEDMLKYLAAWMGVDGQAASGEVLRERIAASIMEYSLSGTKEGLSRAVENRTGFKPIIVEHHQVEKMIYEGRDRHTYNGLFGTNPYKIHIILPEQALINRSGITGLAERVRSCVPAHVEFELVPLRQGIRLDMHTYLEINSYLSDYSGMVVEERSVLYHDVYIGGQLDE